MHAFLIVSHSESSTQSEIDKIKERLNADLIENPINKVEDVRHLNSLLKSYFNKNTIILIRNFHDVNVIASNAFLKTLEEGRDKVAFILTTNNLNKVLPTIHSRCHVIHAAETPTKKNLDVEKFINMSEEEKLDFTSSIKKRDDAIAFLKSLISTIEPKLYDGNSYNYLSLAEKADIALTRIEANSNVNLQLTNLIIETNNLPLLLN